MSEMPNASVGAKRDPFWDALKFALIFSVVYSHIVPMADYRRYKVAVFNFMYLIHMPLFISYPGVSHRFVTESISCVLSGVSWRRYWCSKSYMSHFSSR